MSSAAPFDMTLPAMSKHLRVLERAGLVRGSATAGFIAVASRARPLGDAVSFLERWRPFWDQSLDQLARHVERNAHTGRAAEWPRSVRS